MGGRKLVWQRLAGVEYALSVMELFKTQENKVLIEGDNGVVEGEKRLGARDFNV